MRLQLSRHQSSCLLPPSFLPLPTSRQSSPVSKSPWLSGSMTGCSIVIGCRCFSGASTQSTHHPFLYSVNGECTWADQIGYTDRLSHASLPRSTLSRSRCCAGCSRMYLALGGYVATVDDGVQLRQRPMCSWSVSMIASCSCGMPSYMTLPSSWVM